MLKDVTQSTLPHRNHFASSSSSSSGHHPSSDHPRTSTTPLHISSTEPMPSLPHRKTSTATTTSVITSTTTLVQSSSPVHSTDVFSTLKPSVLPPHTVDTVSHGVMTQRSVTVPGLLFSVIWGPSTLLGVSLEGPEWYHWILRIWFPISH